MNRVLVLWCPDWPAMVYREECSQNTPLAVMEGGHVLACTPAARDQGVRRGMRRRDAQARCPELLVRERQPEQESTLFDTVLTELVEHTVGASVLRPGLCAMPVPSRFHGGEAEAAAVLTEAVVAAGVWDVRCGIADGVFAAEQAARAVAIQESRIVPAGGSASFLASLPIDVFGDAEFAHLLRRLGLSRVGDFAALAAADVHTRFGTEGLVRHRWAHGIEQSWQGTPDEPNHVIREISFEPALENAEALAFSTRRLAEDFVAELARRDVVCTVLRIEFDGEQDSGNRRWRHPRWFSTADLIDRVRWQASAWGEAVVTVRFVAETLEEVGDHAEQLFGGGVDEGVQRGVARVQSMIGPEGVQSLGTQGGRSPRDRELAAIWGERPRIDRPLAAPWPAAVPAPAPATVFHEPRPAQVVGESGQAISVGERGGLVGGVPARVCVDQQWQSVLGWAGPWPVDERWWDEAVARRVARFQVVGNDGSAWLMSVRGGQWWVEAIYD